MEDCKKAGIEYIELPVAFDALTVVVNPKNTCVKQLTVAELKKMWEPAAQGKITSWNQVNPAWPDAADQAVRRRRRLGHLRLLHRSDRRQGQVQPRRLHRQRRRQRAGAGRVARRERARLLRLRLLRREQGQAEGRADRRRRRASRPSPSSETRCSNGSYQPLARPIFIYVNAKSLGQAGSEGVRRVLHDATARSWRKEVKYVPLPDRGLQDRPASTSPKGKKGTVFGGEAEVGVTIDELLKREAKL